MSNPFRRFVSVLMAIMMVITLVPTQAFAASEGENRNGVPVLTYSFEPDFEGKDLVQTEDVHDTVVENQTTLEPDPDGITATEVSTVTDERFASTEVDVGVSNTEESAHESSAVSDSTLYSGSCGTGVSWVLYDDGSLTISGSGAMQSYSSYSKVPWYSYRSIVKSILVETGVTSIGNYAFYNCSNLQSVTIQEGVTYIGNDVFSNCSNMSKIVLPNSLTSIWGYAFYGCESLRDVFYSNSSIDGISISMESSNAPLLSAYWHFNYNKDDIITLHIESCDNGSISLPCSFALRGETIPITVNASPGYRISKLNSDNGVINSLTLTIPKEGSFLSVSVVAEFEQMRSENIVSSGLCGESIEWVLYSDGRMDIYGSGKMNDYLSESTPWYSKRSQIFSVYISNGVNSIGDWAFNFCTNLVSVSIPDSVTKIGGYAFNACGNLLEISIPQGVTSIGDAAFRSCFKLSEITIPDNVNSLGWEEFSWCSNLQKVIFRGEISSIGDGAFSSCPKLSDVFYKGQSFNEINIGNANTALTSAFWHYNYCGTDIVALEISSIENGNLTLPFYYAFKGEPVTITVTPSAGYRLKNLTSDYGVVDELTVTISETGDFPSVTIGAVFELIFPEKNIVNSGKYDDDAYWILYEDGELYIYGTGGGDEYYSLGNSPWYNYRSYITSVVIGDGITSIHGGAFYNLSAMSRIELPETLFSIGEYAFQNCSSLAKVVLPSNVKSLGKDTFSGCTMLITAGPFGGDYSIEYGWTTNIPANAFSGCSSIISIALPETLTDIGAAAFSGCTALEAICIPSGVATIGSGAFEDCSALDSIEIPTGVPTIQSSTFAGCSNLANISIPNSITSIGSRAFYGCNKLAGVTLPADLVSLGSYAFYNCESLTGMNIPGGVASIGEYTFYGCINLSGMSIPDSLASIGQYAFYNCSALEHVELPSGLTSIEDCLFYGCSSLSEITVPSGVKTIGGSAFYGCAAITEIILPSGVTTISSSAFSNCENLQHILIPESVSAFSYSGSYYRPSGGVFTGCPKLKTVGPSGRGYNVEYGWTTSIPSYAFAGCTSIEDVVLGPAMTAVDGYAFYDCTALKSIVIPKSVTSVASYAFQNCANLSTVLYIGNEIYRGSMTINSYNTCLENAAWSYISSMDDVRSISVGAVEGGTVSVSNAVYVDGATVTVYATPDKGYRLSTVLVDGKAIKGSTFTVTGNHIVTAEFTFYKDVAADGVCGSNLRWDFYTDGELRIFGSGAMNNFSSQSAPWYAYRDQIKSVVIENGVASIGNYAFYGLDALTDISIPQSIRTIGSYSFWNCDNLVRIVIPEGVATIERDAFSSCDSLAVVVLPSTLSSIGSEAFEYCNKISDVFYPSTSQSGISIGSYNSYITDKFWHYGYDGEAIVLMVSGDSVVTLPCAYAFKGETLAQAVTVGAKPGYTFSGLTVDHGSADGLTVTVSTTGDFDTVTVGAEFSLVGEKEIVASGFCGDDPTESVMWILYSDGELYIYGAGAMWYNRWPSYNDAPWYTYRSQVSSLTIASGVTSVPGHAFSNCTGLTEVVIPDGVDSIGQCAFYGCSKLNRVEFLGNAPSTVGDEAFPSTSAGQFVIYYHSGTTGWTTPTWNGYYTACIDDALSEYSALDSNNRNSQNILFTLNDESNTATVGDNSTVDNNSGYNGNNNGSVIIPATVTKGGKTYRVIGINQYAFSKNRLLTTLEIGQNITSVDPTAFFNCTLFKSFSVSAGNTHYKTDGGILYDTSKYNLYVYPYDKSGDTFTVPASVTTIGTYAFSGNPHLREIVVPDTVASIGLGAFRDCSSLEKITLPYIGGSLDSEQTLSYVFGSERYYYGSSLPQSLKTVVITGGTLSGQSFYNCRYLESITLSANDTEIPYECFYGCNALKDLRFSDETEAPEDGHLMIPDRITAIRESAFQGCTAIEVVDIPATTAIGYQDYYWDNGNRQEYWRYTPAFNGCTNLTEYRVADANPYLCSDQWGVLYTKDKTTLCDYPSARKWPYYNVADQTTTISRYAFTSCANLVNLYIPNTVTDMESGAIANCPGMTVCAYLNSVAYAYAGNNSIPSWAMDNYRLQGIEIYAMPESTVAAMGQEDFSGLYVTVNVGKVLQLDSYSLHYNAKQSGIQTATVSYMGQTASFDILLYNADTDHLVDFGEVNLSDGAAGYVAMYDTLGKMVRIETATVLNNRVQIVISNSSLSNLKDARLFILNSGSFAPVSEAVIVPKYKIEAEG